MTSVKGRPPGGRQAVVALVALAVAVAACSTGAATTGSGSEPPGPTATPAATPTAPPIASPTAVAATPVVSPPASTGTATGGPPAATLAGLSAGETTAGDIGSYTWDGMASDGPWVVERTGSHAAGHARLAVIFADGSLPGSWSAVWAPIRGGSAGTPVAAGDGHGTVAVRAPGTAGSWSLRLTASFGDGRSATWYWRVDVGS